MKALYQWCTYEDGEVVLAINVTLEFPADLLPPSEIHASRAMSPGGQPVAIALRFVEYIQTGGEG